MQPKVQAPQPDTNFKGCSLQQAWTCIRHSRIYTENHNLSWPCLYLWPAGDLGRGKQSAPAKVTITAPIIWYNVQTWWLLRVSTSLQEGHLWVCHELWYWNGWFYPLYCTLVRGTGWLWQQLAQSIPKFLCSTACVLVPTLAKAQIASLLATQHPVITLKFVDLQMQSGTYDCGLFAIAHATALEIICTISLRWENTSTNHFRRRQWHSFRWRKKDGAKSGRRRQRKKFLSIAIVVCQSFQIHVRSNAATARIGFISIHASVCPLRHYSQRTTGLVIAVREPTVFLYAVFLGLYNIKFKWLSLANNWVGTRDWEQAAVPFRVLVWDSCPGMSRPVPGFSNAPIQTSNSGANHAVLHA